MKRAIRPGMTLTCAGSQTNIEDADLWGGYGMDECWEDAPQQKCQFEEREPIQSVLFCRHVEVKDPGPAVVFYVLVSLTAGYGR